MSAKTKKAPAVLIEIYEGEIEAAKQEKAEYIRAAQIEFNARVGSFDMTIERFKGLIAKERGDSQEKPKEVEEGV